MTPHDAPGNDRHRHWEEIYATRDESTLSWHQDEPLVSLELFTMLSITPEQAVIDVDGGASPLASRLVRRGFRDITVLDIAESALATNRRLLGGEPSVEWIVGDVLAWEPRRNYDVWHDRAVFHFLRGSDRDHYLELLERTLSPHGAVILATFAPDGPAFCSGLPVTRYSADELALLLGEGFTLVATSSEEHVTPAGAVQAFTWIAARRKRVATQSTPG